MSPATTINNSNRVVLDTNIIVSAIEFGGICETIYDMVLRDKIKAVTSFALLEELRRTLINKFGHSPEQTDLMISYIRNHLILVRPVEVIDVLRDKDDNRVLEAAMAGGCSFIVTGDKNLLALGQYQSVKIVTPRQFLDQLSPT